MQGRLSQADAKFYAREHSTTPTHVGSLAIMARPADGLGYEQLLAAIESCLADAPRYRQKVRSIPLAIARPVWIEDRDFDITYHVRLSALPQPGSEDQLHDLVARLNSRPLDRERPLWEAYLIEGLSGDRIAFFTKTHLALVDGGANVDLTQLLLTASPEVPEPHEDLWMGQHEPRDGELVMGAVVDMLSRPARAVSLVQGVIGEAAEAVYGLREDAVDVFDRAAGLIKARASVSPVQALNVPVSRSRRFAVASMPLEELRRLRKAYDCTVNDLLLSAVAGGLRTWLIAHGEPMRAGTEVQVLEPIAVNAVGQQGAVEQVRAYVVRLPVAEANPVVRMRQITHAARAQVDRNRQVAARAMATRDGFIPPTLHGLGARTALGVSTRSFNILVSNAPGPQRPVYLAGIEVQQVYPVPPLIPDQVCAIGITSYNGTVYFGVNADRDGMWDVISMTEYLTEALEELSSALRGE